MRSLPTARVIADAAGLIVNDLSCLQCGYNLRGLTLTHHCPECGTPAARALAGRALANASPSWLLTVGRGLIIMVVAEAVGAGCALFWLSTNLLAWLTINFPLPSPPLWFQAANVVWLASMVLGMIGLCLVTKRDPAGWALAGTTTLAMTARVLVLIGGSIMGLVSLADMVVYARGSGLGLEIVFWGGRTVGGTVLSAGAMAAWLVLRSYARRASAAGVATACAIVLPLMAVTCLYGTAFSTLFLLVRRSGPGPLQWLAPLGVGGTILSLVANAYALVVLSLLLGVFKRAIVQARGL